MILEFTFFQQQVSSLIKVDLHSHLIPKMDDGARSIERSIEIILELKKMGYQKLITTPHVSDMFQNSTKTILEGYRALKEELKKRKIDIAIEIAAEYYIDENFKKLLAKRDLLTFGREKYLLFELSYFTKIEDLEMLIYEMKLAGYRPVLAHPERYPYFHNSIDEYTNLKSKTGVLFQINIISITNYYSKEVGSIAKKLIKHGLVDFIGSDTHHKQHIKYLKRSFSHSLYKKIFKLNNILNNSLYKK